MGTSAASAWWRLLRAGNVFTAVSNIVAGYLLVQGEWLPILPLVFLVLASSALYLAGMVLNDVFDLEVDSVERPERPLPAGQIDVLWAKVIGWGLLIDGLSAAAVASWLISSWQPLAVAILLAITIVAYDGYFKQTRLGPLNMALCRTLNVLLGASAAAQPTGQSAALLYAGALGVYTLGLTLLARNEAGESSARQLSWASHVVQLGVLLMLGLAALVELPRFGWFALWLVVFLAVRVILYETVLDRSPKTVQKTVGRLITLFIPLDTLACIAASGWIAGLPVVLLLVPTYIATRRAPMT